MPDYRPRTFDAPDGATVGITVAPDGDVRIAVVDQKDRLAEVYVGPSQAKLIAAALHCAGDCGRTIEAKQIA